MNKKMHQKFLLKQEGVNIEKEKKYKSYIFRKELMSRNIKNS